MERSNPQSWAGALYRYAPAWLQSAAVSAQGAYLNWLRHGGEFGDLVAEAAAAAHSVPAELRAIQERLWSERVQPAVAAVAAYGRRRIDLAEIGTLPVLTKAEVRQRFASFVRPGYPRWRVVEAHTSGTTGAGLRVLTTRYGVRRNYAHVWRYRGWHGIPRGEWCGVFGGRAVVSPRRREPPFWQLNHPGHTVHFSQYHLRPETVRFYVEQIRERKLRWIHGYPSTVALLAQFGLDAGLAGTTSVQWVTVSSESVFEAQRRAIFRMFGVLPRQHYANIEGVAMVCECPEGRLHVDEDFSLVEFVPVPQAPGAFRIVGSTLDNEVWPLLRYDVGDVVRLAGPERCSCGRTGRIVASIDGRQEDFLVLSDGSRVGRGDRFFMNAERVAEVQIVQRRAGEATFRIVRASGYGDADEAAIRAEIDRRVGDRLTVRFDYVDQLPKTRTGKLRAVVSELPEAKNDSSERPCA